MVPGLSNFFHETTVEVMEFLPSAPHFQVIRIIEVCEAVPSTSSELTGLLVSNISYTEYLPFSRILTRFSSVLTNILAHTMNRC